MQLIYAYHKHFTIGAVFNETKYLKTIFENATIQREKNYTIIKLNNIKRSIVDFLMKIINKET